jgi:hypothetical protein
MNTLQNIQQLLTDCRQTDLTLNDWLQTNGDNLINLINTHKNQKTKCTCYENLDYDSGDRSPTNVKNFIERDYLLEALDKEKIFLKKLFTKTNVEINAILKKIPLKNKTVEKINFHKASDEVRTLMVLNGRGKSKLGYARAFSDNQILALKNYILNL